MYPIAFHIGSHVVYWYGVMIVLACVAGELLLVWFAWQEGIPLETTLLWIIFLLVGGGVGARLGGLLRDSLLGPPIANPLTHRGLVSYGAFVGIVATGWVYVHVARLSLWKLLDLAAPSVALGFAIARVGCFLSGCCYGRPTNLPWGVVFPPSSPAGMAFGPIPLHPAQLYSSVGNLALFVALLALRRRQRFEGFLFLSWAALYALLRFVLECFRADPQVALGLTPAQLANLVIGPAALALLWARGRKSERRL
jgi:phosphatidylglycerol:prolipoprotein diacylglycerol transferase